MVWVFDLVVYQQQVYVGGVYWVVYYFVEFGDMLWDVYVDWYLQYFFGQFDYVFYF